jgi:hypothetical protein
MRNHNLRVAIYARVSGDQQAKEDTIASQLEALAQRIASDGLECDPELRFVDDGYSGSINPATNLIRESEDLVATGGPLILTGSGAVPCPAWSETVKNQESSDGHRATGWTV